MGGWLQEKIVFAGDMLVSNAIAKIEDGDVILTYAASSIVFDILVKAHQVSPLFPAHSLPITDALDACSLAVTRPLHEPLARARKSLWSADTMPETRASLVSCSELHGSHLFLATNIHSRRLYLGSSLQQALFSRKLHSSDSSLACTTRPGVKVCSCSADTLSEHRWSEISSQAIS